MNGRTSSVGQWRYKRYIGSSLASSDAEGDSGGNNACECRRRVRKSGLFQGGNACTNVCDEVCIDIPCGSKSVQASMVVLDTVYFVEAIIEIRSIIPNNAKCKIA